MSTLAVMKARIIAELVRPDLATQIASAISDAISVYQKQRFRFSDIIPNAPVTFPTVAARYIYTSADNANISTLYDFDYVFATIGGMLTPLDRWEPREVHSYNEVNTMSGQPFAFAYEGNQLLFAPVPSQAYTITLGVFRRVAAPASDVEASNPWMVDAEMLIRSRAKYEIATHVTRNAVMAEAMSPDPPAMNNGKTGQTWRAWRDLKGESNRVTGTGRIRSMQF